MIGTNFARARTCRWLAAIAVALGPAMVTTGAAAQNASTQELLNRVDRLQRELSTLQRQVYTGDAAAGTAATAPQNAGEAGSSAIAGRNAVRVNQLETEIRRLTGQIERIDHRLGQINARLDKLVVDIDQRLAALEGRPPAAAAATGSAQPSSRPPPAASGSAGASPPPASSSSPGLGAPPQPLGTIPGNMAVTAPKGPPPGGASTARAAPTPQGSPQEQYDQALSLMLRKQDFGAAETALRSFIDQNPKDELVGNAHYWLGETYYVRKDYQQAAFAFAEGFQKFPNGNKAPDSLLKLGMSLAQLDKMKEACTAYSRLLSNFPDANDRLKARVRREQGQANCQ